MNNYLLTVCGFLLAVIVLCALHIQQLSTANESLSGRNSTLAQERNSLFLALKLEKAALEAREQEQKRLLREKQNLADKLKELYDHDENIKAWADNPCPAAVLECLLPGAGTITP